jgi:hypothetical protein
MAFDEFYFQLVCKKFWERRELNPRRLGVKLNSYFLVTPLVSFAL